MQVIGGFGEEGIILIRTGREADPAAPLGHAKVVHGHHPLHRAADTLGQDREDAVVHIGAGKGDVPQAGGLEATDICLVAGLQEAPAIFQLATTVIGEPHTLEPVLTQQRAGVAVHAAAIGAVEVHPPQCLVTECLTIPFDEALKIAVSADDGALEGGDRLGDPLQRDPLIAKGGGKSSLIVGAGLQASQQFVMTQRHFDGVLDRVKRLLLQRGDPPVPELGRAEGAVEDGRSVAIPLLAQMTDRHAQAVAPPLLWIVATCTADVPPLGELLVEKELLTQHHLGPAIGVIGREGNRRQRPQLLPFHPVIHPGGGPLG